MAKVVQLPGTETALPMKMLVENMKEDMPAIIEFIGMKSQLLYQSFVELKKAGFSAKEALSMCDKIL